VLFGSILLLPLFVQQLLGYNAFLSGMVLAPGGIATLISMLFPVNSFKKLTLSSLASGLLITTYSILLCALNSYIDFNTVAFQELLWGLEWDGLVPLTSLAFSTIKKKRWAMPRVIFGIIRNIAGSFGIAIMYDDSGRRAQFISFVSSSSLIL